MTRSEASRINGAKSHGPVTPEGKARSSMNAVTHGMAANKLLVLQTENPEVFNLLKESYKDKFKPADQVELDVVIDMVAARWRLTRILGAETALIDLACDRQAGELEEKYVKVDGYTRIACAFEKLAEEKSLALSMRYEARLRRTYDRALADLLKLQAIRKKEEKELAAANLQNEPKPQPSAVLPNEPKEPLPSPASMQNEPKPPQEKPASQTSDLPTFGSSDLPAVLPNEPKSQPSAVLQNEPKEPLPSPDSRLPSPSSSKPAPESPVAS